MLFRSRTFQPVGHRGRLPGVEGAPQADLDITVGGPLVDLEAGRDKAHLAWIHVVEEAHFHARRRVGAAINGQLEDSRLGALVDFVEDCRQWQPVHGTESSHGRHNPHRLIRIEILARSGGAADEPGANRDVIGALIIAQDREKQRDGGPILRDLERRVVELQGQALETAGGARNGLGQRRVHRACRRLFGLRKRSHRVGIWQRSDLRQQGGVRQEGGGDDDGPEGPHSEQTFEERGFSGWLGVHGFGFQSFANPSE